MSFLSKLLGNNQPVEMTVTQPVEQPVATTVVKKETKTIDHTKLTHKINGHKVTAQSFYAWKVDQNISPKYYVRKDAEMAHTWNIYQGPKPNSKSLDENAIGLVVVPEDIKIASDIIVETVEPEIRTLIEEGNYSRKMPIKDVIIQHTMSGKDKLNYIKHNHTDYDSKCKETFEYNKLLDEIYDEVMKKVNETISEEGLHPYHGIIIANAIANQKAYKTQGI